MTNIVGDCVQEEESECLNRYLCRPTYNLIMHCLDCNYAYSKNRFATRMKGLKDLLVLIDAPSASA